MKFACICVVKNAEKSIAEWLAFHLAIGVDTILVLDNGSTDDTADIVRQFATRFDVRLAAWPLTSVDYQLRGFQQAVQECGHEFDWCAFIDVDEFIMLPAGRTLADVVDVPDSVSAIAMNWAMFGSSGHEARPEGLVIENYVHRADFSFPHNRMLKTIARPRDIQGCRSTHIFYVTGDYVDMTHKIIDSANDHIEHQPDYSAGRLNHYFTQSREDWQAKVVTRGYHDTERTLEDFKRYDRNDIFDDSAHAFVPKVREIMRDVLSPKVRVVKG